MAGSPDRIDRWTQRALELFWGQLGEGKGPLPLRPLRIVVLAAEGFRRNRLVIHASGLSFYLLLSVVPFVGFVLLLLKPFQIAERLRPFLLSFVTGGNEALVPTVEGYIRNAQGGMVGGLGTVITFGLGFVLLQQVKSTLNVIWRVQRPPGYGPRLIEYAAVLVVAPVLLALAFGITAVWSSGPMQATVRQWMPMATSAMAMANLSGLGVVLLVTVYAYRFLPDTRVGWPGALAGGVVGAAGLVLGQRYSVLLLLLVSRQSPIYGALAVLPFVMVWFYTAWLIFLFGAQLSYTVNHYERELEQRRGGSGWLSNRPYLVLLVLSALQRRLVRSGRAVRRQALARQLKLPRHVVQDVLQRLTEARLVTPVLDDSSRYVPQRSMERVTLLEVLERLGLLPGFPAQPLWPGDRAGFPLLHLFREANRGLASPLASLTVKDLAERLETPPPEDEGEEESQGEG
jgi:membrane protein